MKSETSINNPSAFEVVSQFVAALSAQDIETMKSLHVKDYVVDWVYGDAFENPPSSAVESAAFFPAWFAGFSEIDYEVKRTISAEEVVVTEWVFTGTHTGPLGPPVFEERLDPTGRTIQFRGVTIYDVRGGLIQRETIYMDLATLLVELGARV
ncbi:ester cyclase [Candidatus Leptofilum sp.]|uniref:ester cyclase n=1 Tax=Candidatus Leptofilum sp. TaxID=3241576 RepID=UPI003B5C4667